MKGSKEVVEFLNEVLMWELTAINQYFLHSRILANWGYQRLAKKVWEESLDEMKHAKDVTERILFLEGLPNLQRLGKLKVGETVPEQFKADMELELDSLKRLKDGIKICMDHADHVSRDLAEKILHDEEEHVDWLEAQLKIIDDVGVQNYLAEQIKE